MKRIGSNKCGKVQAFIRLILFCLAFQAVNLLATTYYVSPSGNDNNSGTSTGAPWKTLAKVNNTNFSPGDKILFQRGGEWREASGRVREAVSKWNEVGGVIAGQIGS